MVRVWAAKSEVCGGVFCAEFSAKDRGEGKQTLIHHFDRRKTWRLCFLLFGLSVNGTQKALDQVVLSFILVRSKLPAAGLNVDPAADSNCTRDAILFEDFFKRIGPIAGGCFSFIPRGWI